jgi:hypothetical protein
MGTTERDELGRFLRELLAALIIRTPSKERFAPADCPVFSYRGHPADRMLRGFALSMKEHRPKMRLYLALHIGGI